MNRKLKDEDMDILFRGILKLQTVEDCYDFFEDLCTIAELRAMVQRFHWAAISVGIAGAKLTYDLSYAAGKSFCNLKH